MADMCWMKLNLTIKNRVAISFSKRGYDVALEIRILKRAIQTKMKTWTCTQDYTISMFDILRIDLII